MFEFKGKIYRSQKAAAEAHGLNYRTVWARIKAGKSMEEAFSFKTLPRPGRSKTIMIQGKKYASAAQAARVFGVSEKSISGRLARGLTPEQAVSLTQHKNLNEKEVVIFGKQFPSIASAARHFGVPLYTVHNRLRRGNSLSEAFSQKKLKKKSPRFRSFRISGQNFDTLKEACENYEITYETARHRLRKGWNLKQVFGLSKPPKNTAINAAKKIKFRGVEYPSLTSLASKYGIESNNLRRRLDSGWNLEEAVGVRDKDYINKPKGAILEGRQFSNRNEAARFYGLNIGTVATRINGQGWSLEQALELDPPPEGFHVDFGSIYSIKNIINGKQYVGITLRNPPIKRFEEHIISSKDPIKRRPGNLASAIRKFGKRNFQFEIISTAKTQAELQKLEKFYIAEWGTRAPFGYNISKGGTIGRVPGRSLEIASLGLRFKTIADAARHFKQDPSAVISRLDKDYSPEQAVGLEPLNWSHPGSIAVKVDGKEFKTIKEASEYFNHPPSRVRNRINKGWSLEKALKEPYVEKSIAVEVSGIKYPSIRQAAAASGVTGDTIRWRLKRKK